MSQRIVGLDIGSSTVEAVTIETSLRAFSLVDVREYPLPYLPDDASEEVRKSRLIAVLHQMKEDGCLEADTFICSLPGDRVVTRVLTLPFNDTKQVEATIGFELESHIPYSLDEMVYDYQILGQSEEGSRVFAAAAPKEEFDELLEILQSVGVDPRMVGFGGLAYLNVLQELDTIGDEPVVIVDIGGVRTDICVLEGSHVESIRTLRRGGNAITRAIADALGVDPAEAEVIKREEGLVVGDEVSAVVEDREAKLSAAARKALEPILRGIHQTLQARRCAPGVKQEVKTVLVCGGTSRLRGIHDYMEGELGIGVEPLSVAGFAFNKMDDPYMGEGSLGKGLGLGLNAAPGAARDAINFRRGQYAYSGDFQFLRGKLTTLLLLGMFLVGVIGIKAYVRYEMLSEKRDHQVAQLRAFSSEVLGNPLEDFNQALLALNDISEESELQFFPAMTAREVFRDISRIVYQVNETPTAAVRAMLGQATPEEEVVTPPVLPPGPAQQPLPSTLRAQDRDERLRRLREMRDLRGKKTITPPSSRLNSLPMPTPGAAPSGLVPTPGTLSPSRSVVPSARGGNAAVSGPVSPSKGEEAGVKETDEEEEAEEVERCARKQDYLCVELEQINITEEKASLTVEANSVHAYTRLEERFRSHPCFKNVEVSSFKTVSSFRHPHKGWTELTITFELSCTWSVQEEESDGEG